MTIFHIHDIITDARQGIFEHLEYDHDEDDLGGCPPGESEFARIMISVALIDADGQILKLRATFANTLLPTIVASSATIRRVCGVDAVIEQFLALCGKINSRMTENRRQAGFIDVERQRLRVTLNSVDVDKLRILNGYKVDNFVPIIILTCHGSRISLDDPAVNLHTLELHDTMVNRINIDLTRLTRIHFKNCTLSSNELLDALEPSRFSTSTLIELFLSINAADVQCDYTWKRWLKMFAGLPMLPKARQIENDGTRLLFDIWSDMHLSKAAGLRAEANRALVHNALKYITENLHGGRAGVLKLQLQLKELEVTE